MKLGNFRRFFFGTDGFDRRAFLEALDRHRFQPIDPAGEEERAVGVCQAHAPHASGLLGFDAGQYLAFGIRTDTLRVPAATLRHHVDEECHRVMVEKKLDSLNRYERAEIKERVKRALRLNLLPSIGHTLVVLDLDGGIAYAGSTNTAFLEDVHDLLERMAEVGFRPESVYSRAARLEGLGDRLDDLVGLAPFDLGALLNGGEPGEDAPQPGGDYIDRANRTAHLGPTFLLWLWWASEVQKGEFEGGDDLGVFELWFDDKLVMASAAVNCQEDAFKGGHPASSAEASTALRLGKTPVLAKLRIVRGGSEWAFTLRADGLVIDGLKVPAVLSREDAEELCERMLLTEQAETMLDMLFRQFLDLRMGESWPAAREVLLKWVRNGSEG